MKEFPDNPFVLFKEWYAFALQHEKSDPNAMGLATVNIMGQPSLRIVLLKECDYSRGVFIFYTNLESRKANDILTNPHVALLFHWKSLQKQVRIEGVAYSTSAEESDKYFSTRPLGSQIGAWASKQSQPLKNRQELEDKVAFYAQKYGDGPVPRPEHWGGFCVQPSTVEFWEEKPFRLHHRLQYKPNAFCEAGWETTLLFP